MTQFLYFEDECWPRIGCGWRLVETKRCRKWAYITERGGRRARVKIAALEKIEERAARIRKRSIREHVKIVRRGAVS